ncbi:MAG: 30S ribosomal protein S18 [Candidatus Nealsonbacteria bacterium]
MECYFCKKNVEAIDFKDVKIIRHFVSGLGKIRSKKRTGVCSKHQRKLANAIKRARHLGLPLATF